MKTQVWVYIVVAVLSVGAGVAIAGVPTFEERDPTIQPPVETTSTTTTTTTEAPLFESSGSTSEPSSGATVSTDAETVTTDATTTSTTTTSTTVPAAERETLQLAVANGASIGGAATSGSDALEEVGYRDVGSFDGTEVRDITVIFAANGFQSEAERLADEMGIDSGLIFPIETAPDVDSLDENVQLLVYLGRDLVDLEFFN